MLISVKKIKDVIARDEYGRGIKDPTNQGSTLRTEEVLDESIDVWTIKSVRPFKHDGIKHSEIKEDIIVIYLKGDGKRETSEIHVVANYFDFKEEVNELRGRSKK